MEIHKEELKIINLFRKNIFAEFTLLEIMGELKKKSYNWTYKAISKLGKEILEVRKAGNTTLVKLSLNQNAITYLSFLDLKEANERNLPIIYQLSASISNKTHFFILLVVGSYAKWTETKNSDLDIVIITEMEKKEIMPYINEATRFSEIETDVHVFSPQQFMQMLLEDDENFGKEIFRKHIIFYGTEAYYRIIMEAKKNGLQNKI